MNQVFTAAGLAKHVGVSLRTLNDHVKFDVHGIARARQKTKGLRGFTYDAGKCRKYIAEVQARTGAGQQISTHIAI
jgi:hypothetical protein